MRKFATIAALVTAVLLILSVHPVYSTHGSVGLQVKIAQAVPCRADLIPGEIVQVLRPGLVRLDSEDLTLKELDRRLERTFRNRPQQVVFVTGGGELSFGDVIAVVEVALGHADYVSKVTSNVEHALAAETGKCLDPNIKFPRILM